MLYCSLANEEWNYNRNRQTNKIYSPHIHEGDFGVFAFIGFFFLFLDVIHMEQVK